MGWIVRGLSEITLNRVLNVTHPVWIVSLNNQPLFQRSPGDNYRNELRPNVVNVWEYGHRCIAFLSFLLTYFRFTLKQQPSGALATCFGAKWISFQFSEALCIDDVKVKSVRSQFGPRRQEKRQQREYLVNLSFLLSGFFLPFLLKLSAVMSARASQQIMAADTF